ncbi:MAG: serine O-acetyltransferase [Methylophilaceae bacterium]|nr:serine O-acetyltransferase [Methylophilaceae bacterium]MBL6726311.1 serine O-acetyltransferase [Methylophilaceae bacterium]MBL6728414.1 serine O-acetyltransferase [Methylophilaceae bacterium]MBL6790843.1 serine O-acetyltransferase [Methylophilaceae bacterium]
MFSRLKSDLSIVFDRDPAARSYWEIITTYPGVHAILFHRLAHRLWKLKLYWFGRAISHIGRFFTGIEIHPGAVIGQRFFIDHGMGVVIGETAVIGDDCTLYHGVTLGGTSWKQGKRHPTLENKVVVGAGAKILGPITIGSSAKIGSNAVVISDIPANATAIGIPARVVDNEKKKTSSFSPYAVSKDEDDPMLKTLQELMEKVEDQKKQLDSLLKKKTKPLAKE